MVTTPTASVAPTAHASLLHSIFAQLEKILNIATDPAVLALLPAKYQGYATAIAIVDQIAESVTASAPAAPVVAQPVTPAPPILQLVSSPVALSPTGATSPVPAAVTSGTVTATVASFSATPGAGNPSAMTIAQYLAGPPLRPPMPTPIGAPGLPGEIPIYTYAAQGLSPEILNHVPLGTSLRDLIQGGAYTQAQINTMFGNTGQTVKSATDPRGFTVQPLDISDAFYNTDATAYDWPSVLTAKSS